MKLKKMLCKHDYYLLSQLVYSTDKYKCKFCTLKCEKCNKKKDIRYKEVKENFYG